MKRLILLTVISVFLLGNITAQQENTVSSSAPILLNYKTLAKKAEKSDAAIADEKKSMKASTWSQRGRLFQDIDNEGLEQLQLGIDMIPMKLLYTDMISSEQREDGVEVLTFETMKYFFENNRLRGWEHLNPISEDPLVEALKSYKKAIELTDPEKRLKFEEKIKINLDELKSQFKRQGQNRYFLNDYEGALKAFEAILETNEIAVYDGLIDTLMINYSGIVAREAARIALEAGNKEEAEKMYKKTIDYYSQLAKLNYGGSSGYIQMTRDYYAIGDTLGAIAKLKEGIKQYPDSSMLTFVAAQAYYLIDENEEGLEFVNQRIKEDPECAEAYYWKGLLLTNTKDVEEELIKEALVLYDSSLMFDPTNSLVSFQSGYVNYAVGANYFEQESYEENTDLRKELNNKGVEYYNAAVEMLEMSYKNAGDDVRVKRESLDLLKRIYYKLYGGEDDRYLDVNKRLNDL